MRYIITQTQLHKLVYKYLDDLIVTDNKEQNPYNKDAYRIDMYDKNNKNLISYFWYGPGEWDDDEDTPHNGVGSIHVHPDIVDVLRQTIKIRQTKVADIVADWVSDKYNIDIDEISIYPERKKSPVY